MGDSDVSIERTIAELLDENFLKFQTEAATTAANHYTLYDRLLKLSKECGELIAGVNCLPQLVGGKRFE